MGRSLAAGRTAGLPAPAPEDGLERNISLVVAKSAIGLLGERGRSRRAFPRRARVRRQIPASGVGARTDHARLHDEPPASPGARGPPTRPLPRALRRLARLCRGAAALLPASAARPRRWTWPRSRAGSAASSRCATQKGPSAASSLRCAPGQITPRWQTCSSPPPRTTATWTCGHVLDFTNKAFEALDIAGWSHAETVLSSLAGGYAGARRMEESNSWRNPVDLVEILEDAFEQLPDDARERPGPARKAGRAARSWLPCCWDEDRGAIAEALLEALREGATEEELAGAVAYAAALRIARFPTTQRVRRLGHRAAHLHLLQRRTIRGCGEPPLRSSCEGSSTPR